MKLKWLILIAATIVAAIYFTAIPTKPGKGEPAPKFELSSIDGKSFSLDILLSDKTLLLEFWAPWCSICQSELPKLKQMTNKYNVILISPEIVSNIGLTVLVDADRKVSDLYNVDSVPQSFFINKDGVIEKRVIGAME